MCVSQVIFQDEQQYSTCFDSTTGATVDCAGTRGKYTGAACAAYDFSVVATSGTYTGATLAAFDFSNGGSDTTLNEDLIVTVDAADQTISLTSELASAIAVVAALSGLTGAVASVDGTNVVITSTSTGISSTIAIGAGSGTNAAALFGSGTAVDGVDSTSEDLIVEVDGTAQTITLTDDIADAAGAAIAIDDGRAGRRGDGVTGRDGGILRNARLTGATAVELGGIVVITSLTVGPLSTIAIGSGSGANAAALFGVGAAVAGTSSSGTYTGATFTAFDFSNGGSDATLNEDLTVIVDGAAHQAQTFTLTTDITDAADAVVSLGTLHHAVASVTVTNVLIEASSTATSSSIEVVAYGRYNGMSFGGFDFSNGGLDTTLNEDLIVTVDGGSPQTIPLSDDIQTAAEAVTALSGLTGVTLAVDASVVIITSTSTGPTSTVTIGAGSGANALLLLGEGTSITGSGTNALALFGAGTAAPGTDAPTGSLHACDYHGVFVTIMSIAPQLPTGPWQDWQCALLPTAKLCDPYIAAGCRWNPTSAACEAYVLPFTSKDVTCPSLTLQADCIAYMGCQWDAAGGVCANTKYGYDCRSYVHFTTTNWNTFQEIKIIGVPDSADEGPTGSDVGYMMTSEVRALHQGSACIRSHSKQQPTLTPSSLLCVAGLGVQLRWLAADRRARPVVQAAGGRSPLGRTVPNRGVVRRAAEPWWRGERSYLHVEHCDGDMHVHCGQGDV